MKFRFFVAPGFEGLEFRVFCADGFGFESGFGLLGFGLPAEPQILHT